MSRFRAASLAVFTLGLIASIGWTSWQVGLLAQSEPRHGCGLPILGIYGVAIMGMGVTSLLSASLNAASFRLSPKPRSALRIVELGVLAAPALLAALLVGALLYIG